MRPRIALRPWGGGNYLGLQRVMLEMLGCEPVPLRWGELLRGRLHAVFIHWPDNFDRAHAWPRRFASFLLRLLTLVALGLSRVRVVWTLHNRHPHELRGLDLPMSLLLRWLVQRIATVRLVHSPHEFQGGGWIPVFHPLYTREPVPIPAQAEGGPARFFYVGLVRPYKRLDWLLREWPDAASLSVHGQLTAIRDGFGGELQTLARGKQVTLDLRFVPEEEMPGICLAHDILVLPHGEKDPIVSGAYFLGVSFGCLILMRENPFVRGEADFFPAGAIQTFRDGAELRARVEAIGARGDLAALRREIQATAFRRYGDGPIRQIYREVFRV